MEKVSVIMGVYNEKPQWLKESINSILNQTYENFEFIIVLDNPNNKELEKILLKYKSLDSRIKIIKNEINLGLVQSLNIALSHASGNLIARMDADDIALPNRFEIQVDFMKKNKNISLLGCRVKFINENGVFIGNENNKILNNNKIVEHLKFCNAISHPTIMFRKNIVKKIGGYRNALYAEDYELYTRLIINNYEIANIDEVLLLYRKRENGISLSKRSKQIETTIYLQKKYQLGLKNSRDYFNEEELLKLLENESDFDENLYSKNLEYKDNNKKIMRYLTLIVLILKSKKYRYFFKNRTKLKFYLKKINKEQL